MFIESSQGAGPAALDHGEPGARHPDHEGGACGPTAFEDPLGAARGLMMGAPMAAAIYGALFLVIRLLR